jgi:hypothetical protein
MIKPVDPKHFELHPPHSPEEILEIAEARVRQGFAPPPEVYRLRGQIEVDWSRFPSWAQPTDPEVFEGCSHEG